MFTLTSPTIVGPRAGQIVCIVGRPNLFAFIQAPRPGDVIGRIVTTSGACLPLIATGPISGTIADGRLHILCGTFTVNGFDLAFARPLC